MKTLRQNIAASLSGSWFVGSIEQNGGFGQREITGLYLDAADRPAWPTPRPAISAVEQLYQPNPAPISTGCASGDRLHHRFGATVTDDSDALAPGNQFSLRNHIQDLIAEL